MQQVAIERYALDPEQLEAFGFRQGVLRRPLSLAPFEAVMVYQPPYLELEIWDRDLGEVYALYSVDQAQGEVISQLRQEMDELVTQVLTTCGATYQVHAPLARYIQSQYGVASQRPFKRHPEVEAYYEPARHKIFAMLLSVTFRQLDPTSRDERQAWILNLKHDPQAIPDLLDGVHIFPAYHMNKKHWVSVVLDAKTDWQRVQDLIDHSYRAVCK